MDETAVLIAALIAIFLIVIFVSVAIFFIGAPKKEFDEKTFNGMVPLEIDLVNKRVRKILFVNDLNVTQKLLNFPNFHEGSWIPLNEFCDLFQDKTSYSLTKYLESSENEYLLKQNIEIKNQNILISDKSISNYHFQIELNKKNDSNLIYGNISWKIDQKEERFFKAFPVTSKITRDEIIQLKEEFIGFIGFKINDLEGENSINFLVKFLENAFVFQQKVFFYRGTYIILFPENKKEKMLMKINKILIFIKKNISHQDFSYYVEKIGIVESKKIETYKDLENIFIRLDYLFFKSKKRTSIKRFLLDEINFSEYENFHSQYHNFNQCLENNEIVFKKIPINTLSNEIKIPFKFIQIVDYIKGKEFYFITKSQSKKISLYDKFVSMNYNSIKNNKLMVDISFDKFKDFVGNLKKSFLIPIINFKNDKDIEMFLNKYDDIYSSMRLGFRIKKIDTIIFNLLLAANKCILIIDDSLSKELHSAIAQVALSTVVKLSKTKEMILVYENPDLNLSEKIRKSVGMNNYLTLKSKI